MLEIRLFGIKLEYHITTLMFMREMLIILFLLSYILVPAQEVITIAGMLETPGSNDGPAFQSTFNNPHGIAIDDEGTIYIADRFGHKIRKYSQDGIVTTLAGSGLPGNQNGNGLNASFNEPWGLCVGTDGNIYVADTRNNLIRKITPDGLVSTFAGSGNFGTIDGPTNTASFGNPTGIEMDDSGFLYIADHLTHIIRKISPNGEVTTLAGIPDTHGFADGQGSVALFNRPYGLTIDLNGDLLVADEWNHRVRRITSDGTVSTIAGTGAIGHYDGFAEIAEFNYPWDITVDDDGNIYIADGYNRAVRKMEPTASLPVSYQVSTYAGNPAMEGSADGYGPEASFKSITGIQFWSEQNEIYVADAYNELLRKITDGSRPSLSLQLIEPLQIDPNGLTFCTGQLFEIEVGPDSFDIYTFQVNGEVIQSDTTTILRTTNLPPGPVTLSVIGTDAIGSVESSPVTINVVDALIEDFIADQTVLDQNNDVVTFIASPALMDSLEYEWDFGDSGTVSNNNSDLINPLHQFSGPGLYTVTLIAENSTTCRDTMIKNNYINYRDLNIPLVLYIPNAFTPNNDGENDFLYVRGEEITDLEFYIYNQWGQLVFESFDQDIGWDGTYKGKLASACTYTYLVKAKMMTGEELVKSGHVSILR